MASSELTAKVSAKGWVVIPAPLRKRYGINPGTIVEFRESKGKITIIPRQGDPVDELYGKWANKVSLTEALLKNRAEELRREEEVCAG